MHAQKDESADVSGIFSKFENSKRFNFQTITLNKDSLSRLDEIFKTSTNVDMFRETFFRAKSYQSSLFE